MPYCKLTLTDTQAISKESKLSLDFKVMSFNPSKDSKLINGVTFDTNHSEIFSLLNHHIARLQNKVFVKQFESNHVKI